mmetsp:Transcript_48112/g.112496  ORF Transcript_48112/g.112496 Transcript_48112/m.112496 type:complete len:444 (+) Transcript_48112:96-1427(+)
MVFPVLAESERSPEAAGLDSMQWLQRWLEKEHNRCCFECGQTLSIPHGFASNLYVSITYAISLCPSCAGSYRYLADPSARVRSGNLDTLHQEHIVRLEHGGNFCFAAHLCRALHAGHDVASTVHLAEGFLRANHAHALSVVSRHDAVLERCGSVAAADYVRVLDDFAPLTSEVVVVLTKRKAMKHMHALLDKPGYYSTARGGLGYTPPSQGRSQMCKRISCLLRLPAAESELSIHEAAEQGDERAVLASLRCGASVHDVDEFGWTPLLYAASFNSPKVCALLLGWHAQPDVPEIDGCGWTPLQWAAHKDNMRCILVLLQGGANPSGGRSATHGKTALAIAAAHGSTESVQVLLGFGADPKQLFCGPKKLQHHDDSVLELCKVSGYGDGPCGQALANPERWMQHWAWCRRRSLFLMRAKGKDESGLLRLFRTRPQIFRIVVTMT